MGSLLPSLSLDHGWDSFPSSPPPIRSNLCPCSSFCGFTRDGPPFHLPSSSAPEFTIDLSQTPVFRNGHEDLQEINPEALSYPGILVPYPRRIPIFA